MATSPTFRRTCYALCLLSLDILPTISADDSVYQVTKPPAEMKLDPFYEKYVDAHGYPVVSSGKVNDYALKEAAYLVDLMLAKRPDVRKAMVESGSRLVVMAHSEFTTDIPEYARMKPKDYWDARAGARRLTAGSGLLVCRGKHAGLRGRPLSCREHLDP